MKECPFCSLSAEERRWLLYENEFWSVYLADRQDYPGRCIVVCRSHVESITALSAEQWMSLHAVMTAAETMLCGVLGASMCNWSCLLNDAYKSDPPVPHVHFHCRPRYARPLRIGGEAFTDTRFAHHYENNAPQALSPDAAQALFSLLKAFVPAFF